MKITTKLLLTTLLTGALLMLSGCNTVKGIGQDFEAMGESMQRAGN